VTKDIFNEELNHTTMTHYIEQLANTYAEAEQILTRRIKENPFIHADETTISIHGQDWYVWIFTDGKHIVFKLTETREATIAYEFLADYDGILISDFYPGYDSVRCTQQKCWVHLIRDMNDDLWNAPFDIEYEAFVLKVRNLILPIMEAVQKYGLKKRTLNKFKVYVERFYEETIVDQHYKSELATKYQNRFIRYRESLFVFLEHDGIPWHNNTAECAIRHLTVQRKISGHFSEDLTHSYLVFLGIMQTCRFQSKSFLRFLFSEEMDIDRFKDSKTRSYRPRDKFIDPAT
jgi:hypothetical protein